MSVSINMDEAMAEAMKELGIAAEPETKTVMVETQVVAAFKKHTVPPKANGEPGWFIDPPWLPLLDIALTDPDCHGALLSGPASTGKTQAVHVMCLRRKLRLVTMQCDGSTSKPDLTGYREINNGTSQFVEGPLPEALRSDCILFIEEANMARPDTWSGMNTLLDGSGDKLRLPDGTRLPVGPGFRLVLAMNEGTSYAGTRENNRALMDRLELIRCTYLPERIEVPSLMSQTGVPREQAFKIVALSNAIRAERGKHQFDMTTRAMISWIRLFTHGISWQEGFKLAVLDRVGDPVLYAANREAVNQLAKTNGLDGWPNSTEVSPSETDKSATGGVA